MAGKLSLSKKQPGVIVLHTRKGDQIRLMTSDMRGDENPAYIKLWDKGFLAGAFIRSIAPLNYPDARVTIVLNYITSLYNHYRTLNN
ncbi:hypothetical protein LMH87_001600 [Akanthomyces muscarius]|uniref:Uncharacterized protein n=1 Tax=Akanthomyces muscarius TaxID=2231603 RepID=A0A9W8Q4L9_AKAMU|nr:hypothetical protein LMH87_001600 [Akanthomyces muscarius]KAJ4147047.1 hypothetical protein LMH87_001600 [Akanthomyces muscarius]